MSSSVRKNKKLVESTQLACTFLIFQHECHRPVIHQRDSHMRLEPPGCDFQSRRAQPVGKMLIKPIGCIRRSRVCKRRAITLATVAVQSKLRNHQDFAAAVADGAVHLALVVFEDAEIFDLIGKCIGVSLVILFADTEQDAKSGADLTDCFPPHANVGFGDSLHNGAHGNSRGSQAGG